MTHVRPAIVRPLSAALALLLFFAANTWAAERNTGPWKLDELYSAPEMNWETADGPIRTLFYAGDTYQNRPTRVFAYYGSPATLSGAANEGKKYPGVVLVHGGGGTAFRQWAELWAKRGYAAIAMDLSGHRPLDGKPDRERLPDGGPDQSDQVKFGHLDEPVTEHWSYHAVGNVIRAHSLLRSVPEVDADRTAVTGISWGGYLTCIVASLDERFKAAVPVYGCGYLDENSYWVGPNFDKMPPEHRRRWVTLYDPSSYLSQCRVPIFFVNGTNDFAYPLDSYMKSYRSVPGEKNIRVQVNMPHGHESGWEPAEIGAFIDEKLLGAPPLPRITNIRFHEAGPVIADVTPAAEVRRVGLAYTTDAGPINKRAWNYVETTFAPTGLEVPPPPPEATAWFLTATDDRMLTTSSEVQLVQKTAEEGFEPLFDGVSFRGWRGPDMSFWSLEDGAITGTITKAHAPTMNQYLVYRDRGLGDFELKLDYRLTGSTTPDTNGGFQFRSQVLPNHDVAGYQVDNNFGQPWKVRLYDEHGRHTLAFQGKRTVFGTDGSAMTTDLTLDNGADDFQLDRWHEYHLIAVGPTLTLRVNGHLMAEVEDRDPKQADASGALGLQLHTGPPMKAQFRNIRLKRR